MPHRQCKDCNKWFEYDRVDGLNVKHYGPSGSRHSFFMGGVMSCCPHCEARNAFVSEQSTFTTGTISVPLKFVATNRYDSADLCECAHVRQLHSSIYRGCQVDCKCERFEDVRRVSIDTAIVRGDA